MKRSICKWLIAALLFPSLAPADVTYTGAAGRSAISQQFANGIVTYSGNAPTQSGLCLETVASGVNAQWGTCAAGASAVYSVTASASTSGVSATATNPQQGVYNVAVGLTGIASFVAPSSGIDPIVLWNGTSFQQDAPVTHLGYNPATDTLYLSNILVSAATTTVASFTNTGAQSTTSGAGMLAYEDPTAAILSGNRLGFMLFGGSINGTHTLVNSSGFAGFATENWSATNQGSSLAVYTTPNGSTTASRQTVAIFGNDGSATFTGKFVSTHRGDQFQFTNTDSSLYREGSWDSASGVAYTLPGSLGQYYWTHNVALDNTTGNFLGTDDTGTSTYGLFAENDHELIFHAPSVTAGTVPTFSASAVYDFDTATGNLIVSGVATAQTYDTASTGRAVNTTASASAVTVGTNIASMYIDSPGATITVTLAAPTKDGDRHRVCFGAATTATWAVTSPATASDSLPTTIIASQCVEMVYNSVAGTPTNSAATTWYLY